MKKTIILIIILSAIFFGLVSIGQPVIEPRVLQTQDLQLLDKYTIDLTTAFIAIGILMSLLIYSKRKKY